MRLASFCLAAGCLEAVLIFSPAAFAQHSSAGGGSGGGSSGASGGGGSHIGSSGSSGSFASSRSSGSGSLSHGSSASPGSSRHNSNSASSRFTAAQSRSTASRSIPQPNVGARTKLFSFLRHPFRRPEPKIEAKSDLRRPICFKGPCLVCPAGRLNGRCAGLVVEHRRDVCSTREIWNGGACLLQTQFLGDCTGERMAMENQAKRVQAAEAARQSACAKSVSQDCSDLSGEAQNESSLYRSLRDRYNRCRQRSVARPFSGLGVRTYPSGISFDRLEMNLDYR